ncbi:unnamed protein product [Boreogadus saida]
MLTAISSKSLSKESNSQINIKPIQYIICILSLETSFTSLFRLSLKSVGQMSLFHLLRSGLWMQKSMALLLKFEQ